MAAGVNITKTNLAVVSRVAAGAAISKTNVAVVSQGTVPVEPVSDNRRRIAVIC